MRRVLAALALTMLSLAPARAQDVMGAIRARDWARADAAAAGYADPVARKIVLFYRLLTPGAASLSDYEAFLASSPDWPLQTGLANRRDDALAAEPDDLAVITACAHAPASAPALSRCAQAELRQAHPAEAENFARAAWIAAAPDANWEADFLRDWGPSIGADQDWRRFVRLAWADPAVAAKVTPRLTSPDQQSATAWLAFRHDDPNADSLPAPRQAEPLLVLERLRWLRRANRDPDALALWLASGLDAERAADSHRPAFWDERNILARHRLRDGDPAGAYALVSETAQTAPEQIADAAFLAGWIALRKLNDPTPRRAQFEILARISAAALTQSRAQYWLGRTAQAAGDIQASRAAFAAAAGFAGTFYGQLASGDDAGVGRPDRRRPRPRLGQNAGSGLRRPRAGPRRCLAGRLGGAASRQRLPAPPARNRARSGGSVPWPLISPSALA